MKLDERGFSLIELIVVMALLAVLSAIAVPAYLAWTKSAAYGEASRELMSLMRNARSSAISNNREVKLEIDLRNKSNSNSPTCRIFLWDWGTSNWAVTPVMTTSLSRVGVLAGGSDTDADGLFADETCGSVGSTKSIVFSPNGSVNTTLSSDVQFLCVIDETGARRKHVVIDSFTTGRVIIE